MVRTYVLHVYVHVYKYNIKKQLEIQATQVLHVYVGTYVRTRVRTYTRVPTLVPATMVLCYYHLASQCGIAIALLTSLATNSRERQGTRVRTRSTKTQCPVSQFLELGGRPALQEQPAHVASTRCRHNCSAGSAATTAPPHSRPEPQRECEHASRQRSPECGTQPPGRHSLPAAWGAWQAAKCRHLRSAQPSRRRRQKRVSQHILRC